MRTSQTMRTLARAAALTITLAASDKAFAQTAPSPAPAPAPSPPAAQSAGSKVAAEALFEEGRRLIAEGKVADACPKFADSQQLDPSSGTLLNLANCHEKLGRTASAWATYKEAASLASANGRSDHLAVALKRADALATKLSRIVVKVATPVDGLEIKRDGTAVTRAEWGLAIPIDPGPHNFEVSAPGYKSWGASLQVAADGSTSSLVIPALEALPAAAAPASAGPTDPASATAAITPPPPPAAETHATSRPLRMAGIIVGAAGIVAAGVGGVVALSAKSKYNDSLANCPNDKDLCTADGVAQRNDARALGNTATVLIAVGAAAVATGVVLWIAAPESIEGKTTASLAVVPTLGGGMLRGEW